LLYSCRFPKAAGGTSAPAAAICWANILSPKGNSR